MSTLVPFERALVSSYRLSSNFSSSGLSLRVSEILPLLCSSTPLFVTPPIPIVSPKFLHVPLGFGGRPLGHEERRGGASVQDFQPK